jgi:3-phosphoshikimate 1-carboxyvinyltransferase
MRNPFGFSGAIPPSKSLLIRHLLLTLYEPQITLPISSACADVVAMQAACDSFRMARANSQANSQADSQADSQRGPQRIPCGEAGLVLRLCLGYAARTGGDFLLCGTPRLLARPHQPLLSALRQLGAEITLQQAPESPGLRVRSRGFQSVSSPLSLRGGLSSQFASSLILNAWSLPFPLVIHCDAEPVSEGYLELSLQVARQFGMAVTVQKESDQMTLIVKEGQQLQPGVAEAEADVSSAFAVAALATVAGAAQVVNFPQHSRQPDHCFVAILQKMGVPIELSAHGLLVGKAERLLPISVDLGGAPDLTPVLAVLASLAQGRSLLFGAPQLRGKESDRIATTSALLTTLGRKHTPREDGIEIEGQPLTELERSRPLRFDASGDHRLVMAAAVARWAGFPIAVTGLSAVHKSFPEFVAIAGLTEGSAAGSQKESVG